MLKILIADDEAGIIQLIKKLISTEIDCEIVGETTDGMSALSMIEMTRPDIVITDIRMPGLNGIELIRETRKANIPVEFIIISGYKDFFYAQNAVKYGAADYLLKPIKADELNGALRRIGEKQGETEKIKSKIADMENAIAQSRIMKRKSFLASWARQLTEAAVAAPEKESGGFEEVFPVEPGIFAVLILKLDFDERVEEDFLMKNLEVLGDKYYRSICDICIDGESYSKGSRYYLLFHAKEQQMEEIIGRVKALMKDRITQYNMYRFNAAIGSIVKSANQINDAFSSADYAIMQRFQAGSGKLIVYDKAESSLVRAGIPGEIRQNMDRVLYSLDISAFHELFRKIYAEVCGQYHNNGYFIRNFLLESVCYIELRLHKDEEPADEHRVRNYREMLAEKIDFSCSVEEIYSTCLKCAVELMEQVKRERKEGISRPIKCMKNYIREHYAENLSLDEIVGSAELSNAYGSSIFKKETGMTITNYLIQVRMEEAQKLIRETSLTVNEIAYKVGYNDTRYFSKLFIKTVGIKPIDYRKFYN